MGIVNSRVQSKLGQALARSRLWFGCCLWSGGRGSSRIHPALEGRQGEPCSAGELPLLLGSWASFDHGKGLRRGSAHYLLPQRKMEEELHLRGMRGNGSFLRWCNLHSTVCLGPHLIKIWALMSREACIRSSLLLRSALWQCWCGHIWVWEVRPGGVNWGWRWLSLWTVLCMGVVDVGSIMLSGESNGSVYNASNWSAW